MGYMGFGMRKEVYDRKPKQPFAHQKSLDKTKGSLKDAIITEHQIPENSVVRTESRLAKIGRYTRLVFALLMIAFAIIMLWGGIYQSLF